jgi:peptidoglycan-associated lipoprotein
MTKRIRLDRAGLVLALALSLVAAGCKKKVPAPAPPAPPPPDTKPLPPAAPQIGMFTVEPSRIDPGQSATLRWSTSNATDINISGIGSVNAQGTRNVSPGQTTTYTLTAKGPGGEASRSVTLDVVPPAPPSRPAPPSVRDTAGSLWSAGYAGDAYFDYDKSEIRADARDVLTRNADVLKNIISKFGDASWIIEGHCDERGSAEYNLGLGDRRAAAAKEFLTQLGVAADKLRTVSYGKERPVCTESNETCWQKNRRAHLELQ